jgi:hypothetical protein
MTQAAILDASTSVCRDAHLQRCSIDAPQTELARRLPLCLATLLGTHNSAITLADGYGNRDAYFQQYFRWIKWVVRAL